MCFDSLVEAQVVSTAEAPRRSSWRLTLGIGLAVLVVGTVFAFNAADAPHWFSLFKWIHVTVAVFWVGGGLLLTILGLKAELSDNPTEIVTLARWAAFVGEKLFAPAGIVVVGMGVAMLVYGGDPLISWSKFWVIAGLVGYALTFVTGIAVLSPQAKKVERAAVSHGPEAPETIAEIKKILVIARFDIAVLLLVVADMVTKPFS